MRGVTRVDLLVAVGFVLAAGGESVVGRDGPSGLLVFQLSGVCWLLSLAVRRQQPLVPICVIAGAGVVGTVVTQVAWPDASEGGGVWILALMLAAYSLGAHASGRVLALGVLLPLLVVVSADATTLSGWSRISGVLFVTVFVGLLPTAVGRLVRIRRERLVTLSDQHARIVRTQRAQQAAAALAERLRTAERLQPTLVHGLRALADAAESGADPVEIEARARRLLGRTREEVVALTAPVETSPGAEVPAPDHVRALRMSAQPWSVLAAGGVAVGLAAESAAAGTLIAPAWTVLPAALAIGVALAFTWWRPVPAVALGYVATAVFSRLVAPLDGTLSETAMAMAAVFAVAALSSRRGALVGLLVCWTCQLAGVGAGDAFGEAVVLLVCWLGGLAVNETSRLVEQTRANNEMLAQQEATVATRAVVEERLRLARELHDAIGHSLTVVALQAGAARRMTGADPGRAAEVMRTVSTVARDGVASLMAEGPPSGVSQLVERIRTTGLEVDVDVRGEDLLDPEGQVVAYRVVQEALTNVLRHAPGARVSVVVRRCDAFVEIVVISSAGSRPGSGPGTGRGLVGIRDRVTAADGEVSWTSRDDGGFEVRALLPFRARERAEVTT